MFESSVATLDGVASAMVEAFPGGGTDRDVANQADGTILETLADVDDVAEWVMLGFGVGALIGRIGDVFGKNDRRATIEAGLRTDPLVALAFGVEAIGGEGIAIGT